jgi:hypothetical protein
MSDDAKVVEHIEQVRQSLYTAKESFASNKGVRGELDLMLAEAEMKHLRETKGWRSYINRQTMICAFAFIIALTGFTGWYWAKMSKPIANNVDSKFVSTPVTNKIVANKAEVVAKNNDFSEKEDEFETTPKKALPVVIKVVKPQIVVATNTKDLISDSELYSLVRTARNKLEE